MIKKSNLLGNVSIAVGLLFVVLSMATFVSEANAGCTPDEPSCRNTSPTGPGGCDAGTCTGVKYLFGPECDCIDNIFSQKCYCD